MKATSHFSDKYCTRIGFAVETPEAVSYTHLLKHKYLRTITHMPALLECALDADQSDTDYQ